MLLHGHWILEMNFLPLHDDQLPLAQLTKNRVILLTYCHTILLVSSALVAPSLVLMGSAKVVGNLSSAVSFTTGALNIHSCVNASTSDNG